MNDRFRLGLIACLITTLPIATGTSILLICSAATNTSRNATTRQSVPVRSSQYSLPQPAAESPASPAQNRNAIPVAETPQPTQEFETVFFQPPSNPPANSGEMRPGESRTVQKPPGIYWGSLLVSPGGRGDLPTPPDLSETDKLFMRRRFGPAVYGLDYSGISTPHTRTLVPELLIILQRDPDHRSRSVAAWTLATLVTESDLIPFARIALQQAVAKDKHALVRDRAAWSLQWLEKHGL